MNEQIAGAIDFLRRWHGGHLPFERALAAIEEYIGALEKERDELRALTAHSAVGAEEDRSSGAPGKLSGPSRRVGRPPKSEGRT
jgi:hypothetical protein